MKKRYYIPILLTVCLLSACASLFVPKEAKLVELYVPSCA